jgi:hypothetical protein
VEFARASEVLVRAWDSSMNTQPAHITWNLMGMMNNCHFRILVHKHVDDQVRKSGVKTCYFCVTLLHPGGLAFCWNLMGFMHSCHIKILLHKMWATSRNRVHCLMCFTVLNVEAYAFQVASQLQSTRTSMQSALLCGSWSA